LLSAKNPIIILGRDLFLSKNAKFIFNFCNFLKTKISNLRINILHTEASEINTLFMGIKATDIDEEVNLGISLEKTELVGNVKN
jgi:hypothetical protein